MIKKIVPAAVLMLCMLCINTAASEQENLVTNPGFEEAAGNSPSGWKTYCYDNSGVTEFSVETGSPYEGNNCLVINNTKPNDSRVEQTIPVEQGQMYKIGCYILTENIKQQAGSANITLLQDDAIYTSREYMDTGGEWKKLEFYMRALEDRNPKFKLILRLGGQGTVNSGKARFDSVYVIPVDSSGKASAEVFYIPDSSSSKTSRNTSQGQPQPGGNNSNLLLIVAGIVILAVIILVEVKLSRKKKQEVSEQPESESEDT